MSNARQDPAYVRIQEILASDKAELVRQGNHYNYRLSTGQTFVLVKTPSDTRSYKNSLSQLKHMLQITKNEPAPLLEQPPVHEPHEEPPPFAVHAPEPPKESLRDRIGTLILEQEMFHETFLKQAVTAERNVRMLRSLAEFVEQSEDAAHTEDMLLKLFPKPAAPEPPPLREAPPVTSRVHVTRDLVLLAIETLPKKQFVINDVVATMVANHGVDAGEVTRIRSAVINRTNSLVNEGKIFKAVQGLGKKQTVYEKTAPAVH